MFNRSKMSTQRQDQKWFVTFVTVLILHCAIFIAVCFVQYINILDLEDKIIQKRQEITNLGSSCGIGDDHNKEVTKIRIARTLEKLSEKDVRFAQLSNLSKRLSSRQVSSVSSLMQNILNTQMEIINRYCTNDTVICIPGSTGAKGKKGETGIPGGKGELGISGEKGVLGISGLKGYKGGTRLDGGKGSKGEPGATGQTGLKGIQGDDGMPGPQGQKGDMGYFGLPGDQGEMGEKGAQGPNGLLGKNGSKGDPGIEGTKGLAGDNGNIGPPGKEASVPRNCSCLNSPSFLNNIGIINTDLGSNVTLDCLTNNTVGTTTTWHKVNSSSCRQITGFSLVNGILDINHVEPVDLGQYECEVKTNSGTISKTIILQTKDKPNIFDCDFEANLCKWNQSSSDNLDWQIGQGPTYTSGTGPTVDHTTGTDTGHYIYLDASKASTDQNVRLESMFIQTTQPHCLSMWTHMYGYNIGSIVVFLKTCGRTTRIWKESGNEGPRWIHKMINIPPHPDGVQIIIEGTSGNGIFGDIAIDDISLKNGTCASGGPVIN